jgi:hypothetical protein
MELLSLNGGIYLKVEAFILDGKYLSRNVDIRVDTKFHETNFLKFCKISQNFAPRIHFIFCEISVYFHEIKWKLSAKFHEIKKE